MLNVELVLRALEQYIEDEQLILAKQLIKGHKSREQQALLLHRFLSICSTTVFEQTQKGGDVQDILQILKANCAIYLEKISDDSSTPVALQILPDPRE